MESKKLQLWQERLEKSRSEYDAELQKMQEREEIYRGGRRLRQLVDKDSKQYAVHVRNIVAELIEAQVDSTIPQPKVTAKRPGDEQKAKLIEDMIKNELDRMDFEGMNDMMERTVPIQGGGLFHVEWDNDKKTHISVGDVSVSIIHPECFIPQTGVFSGIENMDYFIIALPQTREYLKRRYCVDIPGEDEISIQYIAYYRGTDGIIGRYSWADDTPLEDSEDFLSRRTADGSPCEFEEIFLSGEKLLEKRQYTSPVDPSPITQSLGGARITIQTYRPDIYPVVLQKNVSLYNKFLGDSDTDKISDQQNTINRIEGKIIDKLLKSGSYLTLPDDATIGIDAQDMKVIRPGNAAAKSLIDVYDLQGNVQSDLVYLERVYEEARQIVGVTDSFQGRRDNTAVSGKAKEIAVAQAAGRMESKRVMKTAAYSAMFELIFKFKLAFADEKRPVASKNLNGDTEYKYFDRTDFLEQDEAGQWYWNDQFLFSCDVTSALAGNREAMWNENRQNLQTGAFGDPMDIRTLILFWSKMEMLHYPGAGETKRFLEEKSSSSTADINQADDPPTVLQSI